MAAHRPRVPGGCDPMRVAAAFAIAFVGLGSADAAESLRPKPYVADYKVRYGSLTVGTSRTELRRDAGANQWIMETRLTPNGLGRLVAGGAMLQHSQFQSDAAGCRPLTYRFDDGARSAARDVSLEFDWRAGRVTGVAETEAVDLAVEQGLQDSASAQAWVQLVLRRGGEPGTIAIIEKEKVKYYRYALVRRERLETAIGAIETVLYRSTREGSTRENLFWYAPALDYVIVQAEQRRDGGRLFQTYISAYRPGS